MSDYREKGKQVLSTIIKLPKNIDVIEKNIYIVSEEIQNIYYNYIYQVVGMLQVDKSIKSLLTHIKEGKFEWENPVFDNIRYDQQEQDEFLINPFEVQEGVLECGKCGSKKTYSYSKQIRRADESSSIMCYCSQCESRWRLN